MTEADIPAVMKLMHEYLAKYVACPCPQPTHVHGSTGPTMP